MAYIMYCLSALLSWKFNIQEEKKMSDSYSNVMICIVFKFYDEMF